jgi:GNAT superfamily N-acetyltransferase
MNTHIISIEGMATAREAAAKMREEKVHSLLVSKRHANDAWGIVSVQDIINGVLIPGKRAEEVNVYEIMTKPIMSVPADMDIRYIARLLHRVGMRRAPVEENGQIVGMVNLLFTISTALGERVALLEDMVVSPEVRGTGIGAKLLSEAISLARERGCKRITLLTDRSNEAAQRFYAKQGFVLSSMVPMRLSVA